MRILLLALDVELSRNRGDSIHVLNLAKSLSHVGHTVTLVAAEIPRPDAIDGVSVVTIHPGRDSRVVRDALRLGRNFRPHVIYERRLSPKISATLSRLLDVPYVVEVNGMPEEELAMQGRPLSTGPLARLKNKARTALLRRASAVVAVTEGLRSSVVSRYGIAPEQVYAVPNGVDPVLFQPRDQEAARLSLGLESNPLVCFVGNLVPWHGLGTLIDAVRESAMAFHVIAIGDGPDRDALVAKARREGVSHRISFAGEMPHSRIPDFIAAADVCVAPATAERNLRIGWSALKLYEYLACGRPLVASAVPGITELIEQYQCGVAVTPGDPKALGEGIRKVISDPSFRENALRASQGVRKDFSWDRTAAKVTKVLDRAVSNGRLVSEPILTS